MPRFAVLMFEDDRAWSRLPELERQRLIVLYGNWVRDLKAKGAFEGGEPLGEGGVQLEADDDGRILESDYTAIRSVLTGYFLVQAADLEAAAKIARNCPALIHGETVIVRPVGHGD
jgi:hypothetical protein